MIRLASLALLALTACARTPPPIQHPAPLTEGHCLTWAEQEGELMGQPATFKTCIEWAQVYGPDYFEWSVTTGVEFEI